MVPVGELTTYELHGMQPVLAVRDVAQAVAYYRDKLGFHIDFVEGDPPVHARVCADPTYSAPTVHIRFEPLEPGISPNPSVYLWVHVGRGLDRLFEIYRDRGVPIVEEPTDRPWGFGSSPSRTAMATESPSAQSWTPPEGALHLTTTVIYKRDLSGWRVYQAIIPRVAERPPRLSAAFV